VKLGVSQYGAERTKREGDSPSYLRQRVGGRDDSVQERGEGGASTG